MGKVYRFNAKIEITEGGGAFVYFPYDVQKEFGVKGRVPVKLHLTELLIPDRW